MNDLFYPFINYGGGFTYQGNPNLQPERSRNNELGLHYTAEGQRLVLTRFDNFINNLIVFNNANTSVINLNEVRVDGWELAYAANAGDASLNMAVTQQNPRDAQTNQILPRRAKSYYRVAMSQPSGNWRLGVEWQYTGTRQDVDILTGSPVTLSSYNVLNLTARCPLDKHLELTVRADNFLNQNTVVASGYLPLGRTVFTGLIYH